MDIAQFQYFKVIAETGSLTKAAEQLHISQPAMSTMLKKFEDELQVELFDRSPNRIRLNQIGEAALIHTNHILHSVEQMKLDLLALAKQKLSLSILFCDPGVCWFCLPRFSLEYPEIEVRNELYEDEDITALLTERTYDLIVAPAKFQNSKISSIPFLHDRVFLSVPTNNKLSQYKSISLKDIPSQPLLYPQIGGYFLRQIEQIITRDHLPITLIKNEFNTTQHLIRTTNFLATISTLSMDLRNDGANRICIPVEDFELNVEYHIIFLRSNQEKIKPFLEWAKSVKNSVK